MLCPQYLACLSALCISACGKSAPPPATPAPVSAASSSGSVRATSSAARRPSDSILKRWSVPEGGEAFAFADLGEFFGTKLIHDLVTSGLTFAKDALTEDGKQCLLQWSASVREAIAWGKGGESLTVIAYDPSQLKSPVDTCIRVLGGPSPRKTTNAMTTYDYGNASLAVLPDAVVFGATALVENSLSSAKRSDWPSALLLLPQQQLAFIGSEKDKLAIDGNLSVTDTRFAARTQIAFADETKAKSMFELVEPEGLKQKLLQLSPETEPLAKLVAGSWHVKKDGKKVSLEFLMQGKPETLAFNLGMLTSLGVYGTRKYMLNAKKSEAYETVGRITKDLAAYVNREELPATVLRSKAAAKPKLLSLPPVPARFENVRSKVYQSTKGDWAAWSPIKFTLESAQRYQYQVQAAKDGMSAEVIAEGDLDGNGIKSRFSLKMRIDPKTREVTVDPAITENNPDE